MHAKSKKDSKTEVKIHVLEALLNEVCFNIK